MIIDLHRAKVTDITQNGEETVLSVEIATYDDSEEPVGRIVDLPVPRGTVPEVSVGDTVIASETPNENGRPYFDFARHAGDSFEDARQKQEMDSLVRNYQYLRSRGIEDPAAWKFALSANIED